MTGITPNPDRFGLGPARLDGATLASPDDIANSGLSFSDRVGRAWAGLPAGRAPDLGQAAYDWTVAGGGSLAAPGAAAVASEVSATIDQRAVLAELFDAASTEARRTSNSASEAASIEDAFAARIRRLEEASGITLENPRRQGYEDRARAAYEAMRAARPSDWEGVSYGEGWHHARLRLADDAFFADYASALERLTPDQLARMPVTGTTVGEEGLALARASLPRATAARAAAYDASPIAAAATDFAAGMVGGARDPLFWLSFGLGPGAGAGKTALARIGNAALKQGAANAAFAAANVKGSEAWRDAVGMDTSAGAVATEIGIAALFGAVPGGALQAGGELVAARAAAARLKAGRPQAGDIQAVADAVGVDIAPAADVVRAAETSAADTIAAVGPLPRGVNEEAVADGLRQAVAAVEDPIHEPAPEVLPLGPRLPQDVATLVDETATAAGRQLTIDDKPATLVSVPARDLGVAPADFQYKGGGDGAGVTALLRDVVSWDQTASGKTMIFEYADGRRVVADGHQRLGLAKRLDDAAAPILLDGYLFREADGWTPRDVRALAAPKNMQEDSGEAIDAARVLRDRPDLLDGSLPLSSPKMRAARALAALSDQGFGMVLNGLVPEPHGALVGAMVPDPMQHAAILAELARADLATERQARMFITEALEAGMSIETQIDLFGASIASRSLVGERVKILDRALGLMKQDAKLFGLLARQADTIETAGNVLDRAGNAGRANQAAIASELVDRLARRTGPLSDLLNRHARAVADGGSIEAGAKAFMAEIKARIDDGGINALLAPVERLDAGPVPEPGATPPDLAAPDLFAIADPLAAAPAVDLFDAAIDEAGAIRVTGDPLDSARRLIDNADLLKGCRP